MLARACGTKFHFCFQFFIFFYHHHFSVKDLYLLFLSLCWMWWWLVGPSLLVMESELKMWSLMTTALFHYCCHQEFLLCQPKYAFPHHPPGILHRQAPCHCPPLFRIASLARTLFLKFSQEPFGFSFRSQILLPLPEDQ